MVVDEAAAALRAAVRGLDCEAVDGPEAARLFGVLVEVENTCAAARVVLAARVEATGVWAGRGWRTAEEWVAHSTGTIWGQAKATLDTGVRLQELPATTQAFRAGGLSLAQASVIAEAARADPAAEAGLLDLAARQGMRVLKDRAREVILARRSDLDTRYAHQVAARSFTHGIDDQGMVWGHFRLPPDTGAAVVNRIEAEADRHYRTAYQAGRRDPHAAYAADAVVALLTGAATGGGGGADMVVHLSWPAMLSGQVGDGQTCMIQGFGPIPLSVARRIMADAFLKGVLVDGTNVLAVKHFGRRRPAELDTALTVRSVLETGDVVCDICGRNTGIEWDHTIDYAKGGPTEQTNLRPLCRYHHQQKTAGHLKRQNGTWTQVEPP